MTNRRLQIVLTVLTAAMLVGVLWQLHQGQNPPAQVVVTPTATLAVTVLPATALPTPAPTMTALTVPERLLAPTRTPVPPLVLPTAEPTATAIKTMQQRG